MIEPLLARLSSRITIVAGKGGVGKTTTAAAIALAFADRGSSTHLISTDPAHSVSDLFEQPAAQCSPLLSVEEFDARRYAGEWFANIQPSLVSLIERGTYLDRADAGAFLDLSIPGIDEVMAALRLVDLLSGDAQRIVVDTAPTGHTLRLLESTRILRSWVAAGRAMADKAGAVAEQLLRQSVRFPAEAVLDEIAEAAGIFERDVLRGSACLVVTRHGAVIQAETDRLVSELRKRNAHVAALITDQAPMPADHVFVAPHLTTTTGCSALRAWARGVNEGTARKPMANAAVTKGDAAAVVQALPARLIWIAGKGGVGKSTCAAALAAELAESRTAVIVSTDPAGSLTEVFGQSVRRDAEPVHGRLSARQIDASAEFDQMRTQYRASVEQVFASLGLETAAQLDRRVVETLFDFAPPGIDEIIALIEILEHAHAYDVTVIDSAPTGHFLRLLEMPDIALQWLHALLRLLVKYHALASLDALGHDLLAFSKRLRQLKSDLMAAQATSVFVVTLAEPMVIAETQRLCAALQRAQIPIAGIILNRADASRAHELRSVFPHHQLIRAPDAGDEVVGPLALRSFLSRWEIIGE
jgi:arsenite-transporting ATPase